MEAGHDWTSSSAGGCVCKQGGGTTSTRTALSMPTGCCCCCCCCCCFSCCVRCAGSPAGPVLGCRGCERGDAGALGGANLVVSAAALAAKGVGVEAEAAAAEPAAARKAAAAAGCDGDLPAAGGGAGGPGAGAPEACWCWCHRSSRTASPTRETVCNRNAMLRNGVAKRWVAMPVLLLVLLLFLLRIAAGVWRAAAASRGSPTGATMHRNALASTSRTMSYARGRSQCFQRAQQRSNHEDSRPALRVSA